jgi:type IV secretory pathway TrbD component
MYCEKCSCGASVEIVGKDWYQISFGVDRWLAAHKPCRTAVAEPQATPDPAGAVLSQPSKESEE